MCIKRLNSRSWLCLILLLALMARSMIPAGFMPDQRHGGGLMRMVICTGHGPSTVLMDADKYSPVPQKDKKGIADHNDLCPFAPVVAQDKANHAPVIAPVFITQAVAPVFPTAALPQGAPPKPWFSQGPPSA